MSKKVTYVCNVCGKKDDSGQFTLGLHFLHSPIEAEIRDARETENHLCVECAEAILFAMLNRKERTNATRHEPIATSS